jgi:hypothetical protein
MKSHLSTRDMAKLLAVQNRSPELTVRPVRTQAQALVPSECREACVVIYDGAAHKTPRLTVAGLMSPLRGNIYRMRSSSKFSGLDNFMSATRTFECAFKQRHTRHQHRHGTPASAAHKKVLTGDKHHHASVSFPK